MNPPSGKSKRIMFVVDAKQQGNLGRYLNHSCSPNLDTQNVIINTADLRFPTVAFFAKRNIRGKIAVKNLFIKKQFSWRRVMLGLSV